MSDGDGFTVDDLTGIADAIGGGVDELGGMPAPRVPDAGVSSASLAGVLGAMSSVISSVLCTAATARQRVAVNHQSYQDVDRTLRSMFTVDNGRTH